MHAVLSTVHVDPSTADQSRATLNEQVVPMLKAAPGFVAAYWLAPVGDRSVSVVVFESEAAAAAAAPKPGPSPIAGVTFESVEVREVVASA